MKDPTTQILEPSECWTLLRSAAYGRLAVDIAGHPDIFPVNYVVDGETIVFRSGPGTKLAGAVLNRHVALEIDGEDRGAAAVWSVVVKGHADEISGMEERFAADDLPLRPWIASDKPNFVRIRPTTVTGRRFAVEDRRVLGDAAVALGEFHAGAPRMRPD